MPSNCLPSKGDKATQEGDGDKKILFSPKSRAIILKIFLLPCQEFGIFDHGLIDMVIKNVTDKSFVEFDNKAIFQLFQHLHRDEGAWEDHLLGLDAF